MVPEHLEHLAMAALRHDLARTDAWTARAKNELDMDAPVQRFAMRGSRRERL